MPAFVSRPPVCKELLFLTLIILTHPKISELMAPSWRLVTGPGDQITLGPLSLVTTDHYLATLDTRIR